MNSFKPINTMEHTKPLVCDTGTINIQTTGNTNHYLNSGDDINKMNITLTRIADNNAGQGGVNTGGTGPVPQPRLQR